MASRGPRPGVFDESRPARDGVRLVPYALVKPQWFFLVLVVLATAVPIAQTRLENEIGWYPDWGVFGGLFAGIAGGIALLGAAPASSGSFMPYGAFMLRWIEKSRAMRKRLLVASVLALSAGMVIDALRTSR